MTDSLNTKETNPEFSNVSSQWFHDSLFESEFENSRKSDSMFPVLKKWKDDSLAMEEQCKSLNSFYSSLLTKVDKQPVSSFYRDSKLANTTVSSNAENFSSVLDSDDERVKRGVNRNSAVKKQTISESRKFGNISENFNCQKENKNIVNQVKPLFQSTSTNLQKAPKARLFAKTTNHIDGTTRKRDNNSIDVNKQVTNIKKEQKKPRKIKPVPINFNVTIKKVKKPTKAKSAFEQITFVNFKEDNVFQKKFSVYQEFNVFGNSKIKYPRMEDDDDKDSDEELVAKFIRIGKIDIENALNELKLVERKEHSVRKANSY